MLVFICYYQGVNNNYPGWIMELGQKLKNARLEAGLSQRQLCGDIITRNMLSQIENGSAKPSFATLQALCARLGKPVSLFWEDAPSQNLPLLHRAAELPAEEALTVLKDYLAPDPMLDRQYCLLTARCRMDLAEQAIHENRPGYARALLDQAEEALSGAGEYGEVFRRRLTLLAYAAERSPAAQLLPALPDNTQEMLLRAQAALELGNPSKCLACLDAADQRPDRWHLLRGDALLLSGEYAQAADCLAPLEDRYPAQVLPRLEQCFRETGNFEKAYYYACKQR